MNQFEVKICGLTNADDARVALEAGADYLGFVLYPPSPRGITAARMAAILKELDRPCRPVAVVVNMPRAELMPLITACRLAAVQLHGDEEPCGYQGLPVPTWRAIRIREGFCTPAADAWDAERYVIDASVTGMYGGTGVTVDWDHAAQLARSKPVMLSGGLTPQNVGFAIEAVRPRGVDVASGVEFEPGRKNHDAIRQFVQRARKTARELELI